MWLWKLICIVQHCCRSPANFKSDGTTVTNPYHAAIYRWLNEKLQYPHCWRTEDTAVLHLAIAMLMRRCDLVNATALLCYGTHSVDIISPRSVFHAAYPMQLAFNFLLFKRSTMFYCFKCLNHSANQAHYECIIMWIHFGWFCQGVVM